MPLARIITHSHACAQELALDLLARGYTVEIISPDQIPDNIADLELRVDTAPGDQLIAKVKTGAAENPASLDFVHHLRAPMADFIRRPIKAPEPVRAAGEPVNFRAAPSAANAGVANNELPVEAPQAMPSAASAAAKLPVDTVPVLQRDLPPIPPLDRVAQLPAAPANSTAMAATTLQYPMAALSKALPKVELRVRVDSRAWFWSAAMTFATVALLALVLWSGMRQTGRATAGNPATSPAGANAAVTRDPVKKDPVKNVGRASSPLPAAPQVITTTSIPTASTAAVRHRASPRRDEDFVARDTVVYLDKQAASQAATGAKLAKHSPGPHPIPSKPRNGVIAASSVTNLSHPDSQAARSGSAIKQATDPN